MNQKTLIVYYPKNWLAYPKFNLREGSPREPRIKHPLRADYRQRSFVVHRGGGKNTPHQDLRQKNTHWIIDINTLRLITTIWALWYRTFKQLKIFPDLKSSQNVINRSLFRQCKFHEKKWLSLVFARGQNVL